MSAVITHFNTLTQIPHCSKEADKLMRFLVNFAKERGYSVEVDEANNILIKKGDPTLCLQAHYDMVCVGKAPHIQTYEEDGMMRAKDSSLGADNGIAIAMMMVLMDEGEELEFLITADEEVGLIGAHALAFDLKSRVMLNLDAEEEAEVYIGCAGGVDIVASKQDRYIDGVGECYEVAVKGLAGGHSGVDIDKKIPSAIKVLGEYLHQESVTQLASLHAGERRNSIPANAVAIVYSETPLKAKGDIQTRVLKEKPKVLKEGAKTLELIHAFKHGVHKQNRALGIPDTSINLAIITTDEKGGILIETSARAMSVQGLKELSDKTVDCFRSYDFEVKLVDRYPSWKPDVTEFTELVSQEMKKVFTKSTMKAIHAGLECGVIAQKYPQMQFASIGPTIRYPHSTREEVDLKSVERTFEAVRGVVKRLK